MAEATGATHLYSSKVTKTTYLRENFRFELVSADKSNSCHYQPSADCLKSTDDVNYILSIIRGWKKCHTAHTVHEDNNEKPALFNPIVFTKHYL